MARTDKENTSKRIESAVTGWRVLEALADCGGPASFTAVVARCGLSPSQTHRYLASLIAAGVARQDDSGQYDLGAGALKLGLAALSRIDSFRAADEAISRFVASSGRTVLLAALGPIGPTIVRWHAGFPPLVTSLSLGSVLPLLRSATGWIFLTYLPDKQTAGLVANELALSAGLKPINISDIKARVQSDGYAIVDGAVVPGLRAAAFPIFDIQARPILVATMLSSEAFDRSAEVDAIEELRAVCQTLSAGSN